jgi:hypothetical protein
VYLDQVRETIIIKPLTLNRTYLFFFLRGIYEFYARGATYEELHEYNRVHSHSRWDRYVEDTSFKFNINGYMHTIPKKRQRDVVERFSYMAFKGKIDMTNPDIVLTCFEECEFATLISITTAELQAVQILTLWRPQHRCWRETEGTASFSLAGWCVCICPSRPGSDRIGG